MRTLAGIAGGMIFLALLYLGVMAYFVVGLGPDGALVDGLGRPLVEAPLFIRMTGISQFAGWIWWFVDMVVFWPLVLLAVTLLAAWARDPKSE